jgi:hypothetical protein
MSTADESTPFSPSEAVAAHHLTGPPRTDDAAVDAALDRLHRAASGTLDEQAEAGEAAHRVLQDRMSDLGGG